MTKLQLLLVTCMALIGGMLGGIISINLHDYNDAIAQTSGMREVVEAQEFRVVDDQGNITGALDGMGLRVMRDKMITLLSSEGIMVYENAGSDKNKLRAQIIVKETKGNTIFYSTPVIELYDKASVCPRVRMILDETGDPSISLLDNNSVQRVLLGEGGCLVEGTQKKKTQGLSLIQLFNEQGRSIWSAP